MSDPHERLRNSIAAGLSLIAVGLGLFLQERLEISTIWPFFPLAIAVAHFTRPDTTDGGRRSLRVGVWWAFVGAWGLGNIHHVLGMRYGDTWPAVLVAGGVMLVWESLSGSGRRNQDQEAPR